MTPQLDLGGFYLPTKDLRVTYLFYGCQVKTLKIPHIGIMWCESHQYPIPNVSGLIYNNHMNAEIYEIDYSVSPGGINMWALDIRDSLGHSSYAEFRNASQALKWIMNRYPDKELNISVRSIEWFNKQNV